MMARSLTILVLSAYLLVSHCQEDNLAQEDTQYRSYLTESEGPSYSFGYGVTDAKTGDVKKVWEEKDGDTVKGHYSVLEPDGSMRTVDYSANAKTGFKATVKNDGANTAAPPETHLEEKSIRDYGKLESMYDFSAFPAFDEKKRSKSKSPYDDSSEYSSLLSYTDYLKRMSDEDNEPQRHKINSFSSKIKHGSKKENYKTKNKYSSVIDIDLTKSRFPDMRDVDMMNDNNPEKYYNEHSNIDLQKFVSPFSANHHFKIPKPYESGLKQEKYKGQGEPYSDLYEYMSASELSNQYQDEILKTKNKPSSYKKTKNPELFHYAAANFDDDYILVPKKKYKIHSKLVDPPSFDDEDENYESHAHDENCRHKDKNKEVVVRKVIKKAKPVINLLDIFDI